MNTCRAIGYENPPNLVEGVTNEVLPFCHAETRVVDKIMARTMSELRERSTFFADLSSVYCAKLTTAMRRRLVFGVPATE